MDEEEDSDHKIHQISYQMLETVMTINIAEFEHFYSVEENNYLTR